MKVKLDILLINGRQLLQQKAFQNLWWAHKQQPGSTQLFPSSQCSDMTAGLLLDLRQAFNPAGTQVLHIKEDSLPHCTDCGGM